MTDAQQATTTDIACRIEEALKDGARMILEREYQSDYIPCDDALAAWRSRAHSPAAVTVDREAIADIIEKAQIKVVYGRAWVRDPEEVAEQIIATLTPTPVAGWRDMDSAPKDGTEILVYSCGDVFTAMYHKSNVSNDAPYFATTVCGELWDCSGSSYRIEHEYRRGISHWMPLPPAPGQPATEGGE